MTPLTQTGHFRVPGTVLGTAVMAAHKIATVPAHQLLSFQDEV